MAQIFTPLLSLRRNIDEPDQTTYTDAELTERMGTTGTTALTLQIWQEKLAAASSLVDISEGGSQRKMSQAADRAEAMVKFWQDQLDSEVGATVLRKIVRL